MLDPERLDGQPVLLINHVQFTVGGDFKRHRRQSCSGERRHEIAVVGVAVHKVLRVGGIKAGDQLRYAGRPVNGQWRGMIAQGPADSRELAKAINVV